MEKKLPSRTRSFKTDVLKRTPTATYGPFKGKHMLTSFVKISMAKAMNKAIEAPEFKLSITPFDYSFLTDEQKAELAKNRANLIDKVTKEALSTESLAASLSILDIYKGIQLAQVVAFDRDLQMFKVPVFMNTGEVDKQTGRPIESMVMCSVLFYEKAVHEANRLHLVEAERDFEWQAAKSRCHKSQGKDSDKILIKSMRLQYYTDKHGEKTLNLVKVDPDKVKTADKKVTAHLINSLYAYFLEELPSVISLFIAYMDAKGLRNSGRVHDALTNPDSNAKKTVVTNIQDYVKYILKKRRLKKRIARTMRDIELIEAKINSGDSADNYREALTALLNRVHALKREYYGK